MARYNGEVPLVRGNRASSGSADISTPAIFSSPERSASCRAVSPCSFCFLSAAFTLAAPSPSSSSRLARSMRWETILMLPRLAAQCNGVSPFALLAPRRCLALL
uniref:Uncharacterized protein n=1 Tax=Arundo donax TaxID=35708 RepID=A0A0A9TFG9_ARUDO